MPIYTVYSAITKDAAVSLVHTTSVANDAISFMLKYVEWGFYAYVECVISEETTNE